MALGFAVAAANAMLDHLFQTLYANAHVQLHIGDPGAAGTANPAAETTRQPVSIAAASGGAVTNDAAVEWTDVAATEDYTHASLWSAAVGGTFIVSGTITANSVQAGDTFQLPVGDLDASLTDIAA